MATNKERREATRANIISAARTCFATDGYDNTHTDNILERAGVSRGAMYHHFPTKRDVFEAVYISLVEDSIRQAQQIGAEGDSPLEELIAACHGWLRIVRKPEVSAILIEQAPQVLGWKRARDIEAKSSLAPMQSAIQKACTAGELAVSSVELTALLINALVAELALVAVHRQRKISVAEQEATLRQFIEGLRV